MEKIFCDKCKKEVTDVAYVDLSASIVLKKQVLAPHIFQSSRHREMYASHAILHDDCFIELFKELGIIKKDEPAAGQIQENK